MVFVDGVQYELRKAIDIRRLQDKTEHQENETYPLENISFTKKCRIMFGVMLLLFGAVLFISGTDITEIRKYKDQSDKF